MARNSEKNFCGLNRYILAKREEGKSTKKAVRPSIHSLKSAEEAKKWIPNIKKEIDYCLRQIECATRRNYSEQMVKDFEERVERLEKEHWRFVHKVRELDPATVGVPWQGREYATKRLQQQAGHRRHLRAVESAGALTSALLSKQKPSGEERGVVEVDSGADVEDTSLSSGMVYHATITGTNVTSSNQGLLSSVTSSNHGLGSSVTSSNHGLGSSVTGSNQRLDASVTGSKQGLTCISSKPTHLLGLEYSSSSSSSDGEEEDR